MPKNLLVPCLRELRGLKDSFRSKLKAQRVENLKKNVKEAVGVIDKIDPSKIKAAAIKTQEAVKKMETVVPKIVNHKFVQEGVQAITKLDPVKVEKRVSQAKEAVDGLAGVAGLKDSVNLLILAPKRIEEDSDSEEDSD